MLESLFDKITGLKACNFITKILQHRCLHVNIVKFLRSSFFYRTPPVAASEYRPKVYKYEEQYLKH